MSSPYLGYDCDVEFMNDYKSVLNSLHSYKPPEHSDTAKPLETERRVRSVHLITIGINKYKWNYPTLDDCTNGVGEVSKAISDYIQKEQGMSLESVTTLCDSEATHDAIWDELYKVRKVVEETFESVVIFYFAGYTRKAFSVAAGFTEETIVPYDSGTDFSYKDISQLDLVAWCNTLESAVSYVIIDTPHPLSEAVMLTNKQQAQALTLTPRDEPARCQRTNQQWIINSRVEVGVDSLKSKFIFPYLSHLLRSTTGTSAPTAVVLAALQDTVRCEDGCSVTCPGQLLHNYFLTSKLSPSEPGLRWVPAISSANSELKLLATTLRRCDPKAHLHTSVVTSKFWCAGQFHTITIMNGRSDSEPPVVLNSSMKFLGRNDSTSFIYKTMSTGEFTFDFKELGNITITSLQVDDYNKTEDKHQVAEVTGSHCSGLPCDFNSVTLSVESAIDNMEIEENDEVKYHNKKIPICCGVTPTVEPDTTADDRSPKVSISLQQEKQLNRQYATIYINNNCISIPIEPIPNDETDTADESNETKQKPELTMQQIREYAGLHSYFDDLLVDYDLSFGFCDVNGIITNVLSPNGVYSDVSKCMYSGRNSNILLKPVWKGSYLQRELYLRNMSTNFIPSGLGGVIKKCWKKGYRPDGYERDSMDKEHYNTRDAFSTKLEIAKEEEEEEQTASDDSKDVYNLLFIPVRCVGQSDVSDACTQLTSPIVFLEDYCTDAMLRGSLAIVTSALSSSKRQVMIWIHISCHSIVSGTSQILYMYDTPKYTHMTSAARRSGGVTTAIFNNMVCRLPRNVRLQVVLDTSKGYPTGGAVLPGPIGCTLPESKLLKSTLFGEAQRSSLTIISACREGMHSWMLPPSGYLTRHIYKKVFWNTSMQLLKDCVITWHQFFCVVSLACSRLAWKTELKQQYPSVVHSYLPKSLSYRNCFTFTELVTRPGILFITGGMIHGISKGDIFSIYGLGMDAKVKVHTTYAATSIVMLLIKKSDSLTSTRNVNVEDLYKCYAVQTESDRIVTLSRMINCNSPFEGLLHGGGSLSVGGSEMLVTNTRQNLRLKKTRNFKVEYKCGIINEMTLSPSDSFCVDYWTTMVLFDEDGSTQVIAESRSSENLSCTISLSTGGSILLRPFIRIYVTTSPLYFMDTPPICSQVGVGVGGCLISLSDSLGDQSESVSNKEKTDNSFSPPWSTYDVVLEFTS